MNFLAQFQEARRIYGFCPCCGEPFRLSDAQLVTGGPDPRTPFDVLEDERDKLAMAQERFEEAEGRMRSKAREAGRVLAQRRLQRLLPFFTKRRLAPQDIKVLFHPVEYIGFRGMSDGGCTGIEFIDRPATTKEHGALQNSIDTALAKRRVEWQTFRVDQSGTITV